MEEPIVNNQTIIEDEKPELTTYTHEDIIYFVGYEIAKLFGYKNTGKVVLNNVSEHNKINFRNYPGTKIPELDPRTVLITKNGVAEILSKTRKTITPEVYHTLQTFDINITKKEEKLKKNSEYLIGQPSPPPVEQSNIILIEDSEFEQKSHPIQQNNIIFIEDDDEQKQELTTYSYISNHLCFEYFVGYEIAALLGYRNTQCVIINNVSRCNQLVFRDYPGVKIPELNPKTILITRDGAIEILLKTRKLITPDVHHILNRFNIEVTNKKCLSKEQQTLSAICNVFKTENTIPQYPVGNYNLDLYLPDYKIIVECDEHGHRDRKENKEREREEFVNISLSITMNNWVRFDPDAVDFELSAVIGRIYMKINEMKNVIMLKFCSTCRVEKSVNEFHKDKNRSDGYGIRCKDCRTQYNEKFNKAKEITEIIIPEEKLCLQCNTLKLSGEFYRSGNRKDGLNIICKSCCKKHDDKIKNMEKIVPTFKTCSTCKVLKKVEENFGKRQKSFDGYVGVCKDCCKILQNIRNAREVVPCSEKTCSKCGETKEVTENFRPRKKSRDGYYGICKVCCCKKEEEYRMRKKSGL